MGLIVEQAVSARAATATAAARARTVVFNAGPFGGREVGSRIVARAYVGPPPVPRGPQKGVKIRHSFAVVAWKSRKVRGTFRMNFVVGETVVYPHHGAATIQDIFKRTVAGEEKTYLELKVSQSDLIIKVPAENLDLVGVRDVVDQAGLEKVFAVLREPYIEEPTNWSRR